MAVERVEIHEHEPYEHGLVGVMPYELIRATAHLGVEPTLDANSRITDLALAADGDGVVRFSADLLLALPSQTASMPLVYVVANRGRAGALPFDLGDGEDSATSNPTLRAGDGFLLRRGYGVAWSGWQWDVVPGPNLLGLDPPLALENGEPPPGVVEMLIEVDERRTECILIDARTSPVGLRATRAGARIDTDARLFVHDRPFGPWTPIDQDEWRFGRVENGVHLDDFDYVTLDGGFEEGKLYRLRYRPAECPVSGAGLLSSRDVVSMLRYDSAKLGVPIARVDKALGFGVSQSGRYLRQFLFDGLNVDEAGRPVFDGLLIDVAGPRRGDFNLRYGQPSVNRSEGPGVEPPYPMDHPEGGLLDRQRALGHVPKTMLVNTASEYWRRNASLLHIERDATSDLDLADDVRAYLIAGASHVLGAPATAGVGHRPGNAPSTLSRSPALRALLVALERWTNDGTEPPASRVPSLASASAVSREQVLAELAAIPGLALPSPEVVDPVTSAQALVGPHQPEGLSPLVSAVDADGNECAGVILPEVAAPTATHLGFNTREPRVGEPIQVIELVGTSHTFKATRAAREADGDPRPSLEERYADEADYVSQVRAAAVALVADGLLLADDVEAFCRTALAHYRAITSAASTAEEPVR